DLVADEHSAAVHRHLDVDPELLAADLSGGGKTRAVQAVGVDGASGELQGQLNGAGVSLDGQVALEDELFTLGLEACGVEAELRVLFDVEEVGRTNVVVTVAVVGVDRSGVDRGFDGGLHGVFRDGQRGIELLEASPHLAHHHVTDGKTDGRVGCVDLPGTGLQFLLCHGLPPVMIGFEVPGNGPVCLLRNNMLKKYLPRKGLCGQSSGLRRPRTWRTTSGWTEGTRATDAIGWSPWGTPHGSTTTTSACGEGSLAPTHGSTTSSRTTCAHRRGSPSSSTESSSTCPKHRSNACACAGWPTA